MDRIVGANVIDLGGGRRGFRSKDTVAGLPGTELTATWHNAVQEELLAVIEALGYEPSAADLKQILRAIRSQGFNYITAAAVAGTANDIVLTLDPVPLSWNELRGTPLRFLAEAANGGAMTVAVAGLAGTKPLVDPYGVAFVGGAILSGDLIEAEYDGTSLRLTRPVAASAAEQLAGSAVKKFITPDQLRAATVRGTSVVNGTGQTIPASAGEITISSFVSTQFNDVPVTVNLGAGTITLSLSGFYMVQFWSAFISSGDVILPYANARVNGTIISSVRGPDCATNSNTPLPVVTFFKGAPGDVITFQVSHNSSAARNVNNMQFRVMRLGDV